VRCSTHCPDGGSAGILAAVVLVITAAAVYAARVAITDALELLLAVASAACIAGSAVVVSVLRRDRGRQWRPGITATRTVPSYRVTVVKPAAAVSAQWMNHPSSRAIEAPAYRISPLTDRIEEPSWKPSSS